MRDQERVDEAVASTEFYNDGSGALLDQDVPDARPRPIGTASYDPADNKIRVRPFRRLGEVEYRRVKDAGFKWAPKQELFVAPMWTPAREDLAIELCWEIGDEDTSLVERAEERAERFENYSDKRELEAHRAKDAVAAIADGIPLGQPILVGHHSERRARKDAERVQSGMRKAVSLWETSKYWERRAKGALAHAKYKELPTVRARRIKTIEADKRKAERQLAADEKELALWLTEGLTHGRAMQIADTSHHSFCFPVVKYPRKPSASTYEGMQGLWGALRDETITADQARELVVPRLESSIAHGKRWLIHYEMRLIYENCMLEESGYIAPQKARSLKETLPLLNYRAETITYPNPYRSEDVTVPQIEMTKAEYARINKDYKGTRIVERSHKVRTAMRQSSLYAVFLTDSKVHEKPVPGPEPELPAPRIPRPRAPEPERTEFDAMKDALRGGKAVTVVSAPQLFPTPRWLADRMVELLDAELGNRVLEPSAGTGVLLDALKARHPHMAPTAVEINSKLAADLRVRGHNCLQGDFLELLSVNLGGLFDAVIMNPPFAHDSSGARGPADIAHIYHARELTKSGGRVVAICANGPRQNAQLKPLASRWEELPDGTFKAQGTSVRTVLAVFDC